MSAKRKRGVNTYTNTNHTHAAQGGYIENTIIFDNGLCACDKKKMNKIL